MNTITRSRLQVTQEMMRPRSYEGEKRNAHAVVFYTEGTNGHKPAAVAFIGKSAKSVWHYNFPNAVQLHATADAFLEGQARRFAEKVARQAQRRALDAREHLKVGDIIYNSWGYEQTNIDFYQIVKVTKARVVLCPIRGQKTETGFMSGSVSPLPDQFFGEETTHGIYASGTGCGVNFRHGCGSIWDGKPKHYTCYG